jgi:transposase-like protein
MARAKRSFTPEFRADRCGSYIRARPQRGGCRTQSRPAREHAARLGAQCEGPRPGDSRRRSPEQEEIARLRRELRNVTEERDILKKAAAYFASSRRGGTPS